jgi:hypothetical protein
MSMHAKMPREVDKIFVKHPSNLGGGGSWLPKPPRPSSCFGLLMMNPSRPPLLPNRHYHRPLNYPKYVNFFDPNVHVKVFKATIRTNG